MIKQDSYVRRQSVCRLRRIVVSLVTLALGAMSVVVEASPCSVVIVGTNDAATDVQNVQQAVDGCANVVLQGKFRFVGMETGDPLRVVTVHESVNITGQPDNNGLMPQIVGGYAPLLVDAPGGVVRIKGLRFYRPVSRAIQVGSAQEAVVADCDIKAVEPVNAGDAVFGIVVGGALDSPISQLTVVNNTIANSSKPFEVGVILAPSSVVIGSTAIARNEIHAKVHGIDLRDVGGSVQVNHNRITIANSDRSGDVDTFQSVDGIRCWGSDACKILGNQIESHHPNSSGVRLQQSSGAIVEDNTMQMTPPDGSILGANSSGVELIWDPARSLVGRNRVSGAARTAFSVSGADNVLVLNRHGGFAPSFADTEIGEGALRTVVVGEDGNLSDLGTGSVVR